jgi:hypothetical protein
MFNEFNPESQRAMRHMSQARFGITLSGDLRGDILRNMLRRMTVVKADPMNQWQVYELCKCIYSLAELDRVDFNGAGFMEKVRLVHQLAPFADPAAIAQGVLEYHDSRRDWTMDFLRESEEGGYDTTTIGS